MKLLRKNPQPEPPAAPEPNEIKAEKPVKEKTLPAKKGRPTPSRNQANAMHKAPVPPPPKTRAEAAQRRKAVKQTNKPQTKEEKKALRTEKRLNQQLSRERMMRGEEEYLPVQHKGPVKRRVRDFIDSRHAVSNFLLPITFASFLISMFLGTFPQWRPYTNYLVIGVVIVLVADAIIAGFLALRNVRASFPKDTTSAASIMIYAAARSIQLPRMRTPLPEAIVAKRDQAAAARKKA